jgi:CheY-like chemotaxis protein
MQEQTIRVVIATEHAETRSFLSRVIEQEDGVEIIGQAPDAIKALVLTRNLRPDIVILDCFLPYSFGIDSVPLSRISGLDAAQTITEEIPKTRVMLLNNLDKFSSSGGGFNPDRAASYRLENMGAYVSISRLGSGGVGLGSPVFASVAVKEQEAFRQKTTGICDKIIFFGTLGFAAGLLLIITFALAPIGAPLAAVGALVALSGLAGKLVASLLRKVHISRKQAGGK